METSFFLGANTPDGFFGYFDSFVNVETADHLYIIKGGPGTGKSSAMKKIAKAAAERGLDTQMILCPSDPDSSDGLFIPEKRLAFVDGTAPHVLDPAYPGAFERIVNFADFLDCGRLKDDLWQIIELDAIYKGHRRRANSLIKAAACLIEDSDGAAALFIDNGKLAELAEKQAAPFTENRAGKRGREFKRFLNGVTPDGFKCLYGTAAAMAGRVVVLDDEHGIMSRFLGDLKERFLSAGYDVYACASPIAPLARLEHIIAPEIGCAWVTRNCYQDLSAGTSFDFSSADIEKIDAKKFVRPSFFQDNKSRLAFNRKTAKSLLKETVAALADARRVHGGIEERYIGAMDFSGLDEFIERLIRRHL
ncbi:MAG: hypothetical protein FWF44_00460 [Defluviitaleaceae bacterium]|nr:hypothetical protein [Defluviitaleaceae bacterium]